MKDEQHEAIIMDFFSFYHKEIGINTNNEWQYYIWYESKFAKRWNRKLSIGRINKLATSASLSAGVNRNIQGNVGNE